MGKKHWAEMKWLKKRGLGIVLSLTAVFEEVLKKRTQPNIVMATTRLTFWKNYESIGWIIVDIEMKRDEGV